MEPPYEGVPGVQTVEAGYANGAEVVRVAFDPKVVGYPALLRIFWRQIDPTDAGGQFCDKGAKYRSAIFYLSEDQRKAAEASRAELEAAGRFKAKIVTEIAAAQAFERAADRDQDYYLRNPIRYNFYRFTCGRDQYLDKIWGKDRETGHRSVDPSGAVPH